MESVKFFALTLCSENKKLWNCFYCKVIFFNGTPFQGVERAKDTQEWGKKRVSFNKKKTVIKIFELFSEYIFNIETRESIKKSVKRKNCPGKNAWEPNSIKINHWINKKKKKNQIAVYGLIGGGWGGRGWDIDNRAYKKDCFDWRHKNVFFFSFTINFITFLINWKSIRDWFIENIEFFDVNCWIQSKKNKIKK